MRDLIIASVLLCMAFALVRWLRRQMETDAPLQSRLQALRQIEQAEVVRRREALAAASTVAPSRRWSRAIVLPWTRKVS